MLVSESLVVRPIPLARDDDACSRGPAGQSGERCKHRGSAEGEGYGCSAPSLLSIPREQQRKRGGSDTHAECRDRVADHTESPLAALDIKKVGRCDHLRIGVTINDLPAEPLDAAGDHNRTRNGGEHEDTGAAPIRIPQGWCRLA